MTESDGFLSDGYSNLRSVYEQEIRNQVEAEFAPKLENARWLERRRLKKQIENEIDRRCDERAPPDALY